MRPVTIAAACSVAVLAAIVVPKFFSNKNNTKPVVKTMAIQPVKLAKPLQATTNNVKDSPSIATLPGVQKKPLISKTKQSKPANNKFVYEPFQGGTFVADNGTKLWIPQHAFVDAVTGDSIVGPVDIKLNEYYTMDDIVMNDLHTESTNGLLETNGMINVQVTAKGRACKFAKDKEMTVGFPMVNDKPDMQLFWKDANDIEGVWRSIDYRPNDLKITSRPVPLDAPTYKVPTLSRGLTSLKYYLDNSVTIPFDSWNGTMNVELLITPWGAAESVKVLQEISPEATAQIGVALKKLQWQKGFKNGQPDRFKAQISIEYKQRKGITSIKFIEPFKHAPYEPFFDRTPVATLAIKTFPVSTLGWINCDRFLQYTNKTNFIINNADAHYASVKIIFDKFKSILPAKLDSSGYRFDNIPANEPITVIAIKKSGSNYMVALQKTNTSAGRIDCLDYTTVSSTQLTDIILSLDKISKPLNKSNSTAAVLPTTNLLASSR